MSYRQEPTVPEMVELFENKGLKEITTTKQRRRGSMAFYDTIASNGRTNKPVRYIVNGRSGFMYRQVGSNSYPVNERDTDTRQYSREYNRARSMRKNMKYIETFRNRMS